MVTFEELLSLPEIASYPDIPDFRLLELIGEGAFSTVYKAVNIKAGYLAALKIISKSNLDAKQNENVNKEVILTRRISHPNIVRLIDFRETPYNYVIALEYMSGGELYATLRDQVCFSEDVSRKIILQIAKALQYLHDECGIVHRDIKLENILFNSVDRCTPVIHEDPRSKDEQIVADPDAGKNIGVVKIADFGLSKVIHNTSTLTPCGTVGYIAPEILKDGKYSKGVDVWALGCVIYTIICGFPPFFDDCPKGLADKVEKGSYAFLSPWWDSISIECKDLISHLLEIEPLERYTMKDLLSHPWMLNMQFGHSFKPSKKLLAALNNLPPNTSPDDFVVGSPIAAFSFLPDEDFIPSKAQKLHSSPSISQIVSHATFEHPAPDIPVSSDKNHQIPPFPDLPSSSLVTTAPQNSNSNPHNNKFHLPTELCSKDILAAPLNIYQSMCDRNTNSTEVLQFVKVYNGNGTVPTSNATRYSNENILNPSLSRNPNFVPNSSDSHAPQVSFMDSRHHSYTTTDPNSPTLEPQINPITPFPNQNISHVSRVPATEVKIIHGLRRDIKNFKLDMEISPLYNRRRRAWVGITN